MNPKQFIRSAATVLAGGVGLAAASYAGYVAVAWFHYGNVKWSATGDDSDALLDRFMPHYEIAGRHKIRVDAPAEVVLSAASEINLESSVLVRGIFKGREWILRSKAEDRVRPRGLVALTKSLGWGVLAETPREIVMGCATKPWESNPVFRALSPEEFAAFQEPGYVKIVWTLRADPAGDGGSVFHTETRAVATDPEARRKFRRYWSFLSPGIILMRAAMLPAVKREAERHWNATAA